MNKKVKVRLVTMLEEKTKKRLQLISAFESMKMNDVLEYLINNIYEKEYKKESE